MNFRTRVYQGPVANYLREVQTWTYESSSYVAQLDATYMDERKDTADKFSYTFPTGLGLTNTYSVVRHLPSHSTPYKSIDINQ